MRFVAGIVKYLRAWTSIVMLVTIAACGGSSSAPAPPPPPGTTDSTPPAVSSVAPAVDAGNVALNTVLTVTFSEAMDTATLNDATFTLREGGGAAVTTGTVTAGGASATFTPASPLLLFRTYTATITTGAKDLAGNPLAAE